MNYYDSKVPVLPCPPPMPVASSYVAVRCAPPRPSKCGGSVIGYVTPGDLPEGPMRDVVMQAMRTSSPAAAGSAGAGGVMIDADGDGIPETWSATGMPGVPVIADPGFADLEQDAAAISLAEQAARSERQRFKKKLKKRARKDAKVKKRLKKKLHRAKRKAKARKRKNLNGLGCGYGLGCDGADCVCNGMGEYTALGDFDAVEVADMELGEYVAEQLGEMPDDPSDDMPAVSWIDPNDYLVPADGGGLGFFESVINKLTGPVFDKAFGIAPNDSVKVVTTPGGQTALVVQKLKDKLSTTKATMRAKLDAARLKAQQEKALRQQQALAQKSSGGGMGKALPWIAAGVGGVAIVALATRNKKR